MLTHACLLLHPLGRFDRRHGPLADLDVEIVYCAENDVDAAGRLVASMKIRKLLM